MRRLLREFRLIPLVLLAVGSLLVLKLLGLLFYGGYLMHEARFASTVSDARSPPAITAPETVVAMRSPARQSWMQEMFSYPDVTGSVQGDKTAPAAKPADAPVPSVPAPKSGPDGTVVQTDVQRLSAGERAVLERLGERRQELDARAREIDIRESLLKAAETRLEARAAELKAIEARIDAAMHRKDDADVAKFKGLITMYEGMKAKDAARIFDRLDMKVLIEIASQINPRRLSEILPQMSGEAAERLTVELANRIGADKGAADLPKIEGRPAP